MFPCLCQLEWDTWEGVSPSEAALPAHPCYLPKERSCSGNTAKENVTTKSHGSCPTHSTPVSQTLKHSSRHERALGFSGDTKTWEGHCICACPKSCVRHLAPKQNKEGERTHNIAVAWTELGQGPCCLRAQQVLALQNLQHSRKKNGPGCLLCRDKQLVAVENEAFSDKAVFPCKWKPSGRKDQGILHLKSFQKSLTITYFRTCTLRWITQIFKAKAASDGAQQGRSVCTQVPNLHPSSVFQCLWRVLYNKSFLSQTGTCFLWFVLWCLFFSCSCWGDTAIGCDRPMSPRDCRAGCVCQALCSCRAQCQQWGLCLCCRKPDSAAKSSSCLQGLPEKPSAGIPLGWEQSLLDRVTGLLHLCTEHGDRTPPKASPRGSRAPHCLRVWPKCKGLFSSLPYPGGLYLKLAETCGKTCWLPHVLGLKLWLDSPSATCV